MDYNRQCVAMKFYRDLDLGLSCTPDVFIIDPTRPGFGVCNIKSVAPVVFKNKWLKGYHRATDDTPAWHDIENAVVEPPLYAIIQVLLEAHMTGASWACIAALVVDHGITLHLIDVPLHALILDRLCIEAKGFWQAVRDGLPPEWDFARDGALLSQYYADETGETIDLSGVNDLPELVAEDEVLKARMKADKDRRDQIKNRFKAELRGNSVATYNGRIIAERKIIQKKGYSVQPSQYAQIILRPEAIG
jgi:hypothetical protein